MSSFVNCFDVVSMVVEEATQQFAPLWKINNENMSILEQYCEHIDNLAAEFDGESFEVEVDEIDMSISIKMECSGMLIKNKEHSYYELAKRTVSFGFSATDDGRNLIVEFVFPSVWEKI